MPGSLQIKGLRVFLRLILKQQIAYIIEKIVEPLDQVKMDVNIKAIGLIPLCIFCTSFKIGRLFL